MSCFQRTRRGPFYWCETGPTPRGDWDYCSPYPKDACAWSTWGAWSQCSLTCGPREATRTRRRRLEMAAENPDGRVGGGRVGDCSGAIEQSIQLCKELPHCQGKTYQRLHTGLTILLPRLWLWGKAPTLAKKTCHTGPPFKLFTLQVNEILPGKLTIFGDQLASGKEVFHFHKLLPSSSLHCNKGVLSLRQLTCYQAFDREVQKLE